MAFIYSCYEFDETQTEKGNPFRHRRLADCHLNGLVMLDIDHVENPMQIWYKLRDDEELMKKIALVHITGSKFGIRIVSVADINLGNLADNQIVLAEKLGQKPDESCIDATRNSFAPKEEDILYINEDLLFNYYNEEFDKKYTPMYREKKTQPLYHKFPSDSGADSANRVKSRPLASADASQGSGQVSSVDGQRMEGVANGPLELCSLATEGTQECSMFNVQWSMYKVVRL